MCDIPKIAKLNHQFIIIWGAHKKLSYTFEKRQTTTEGTIIEGDLDLRCEKFYLWLPYVIGQAIIFLPCGFYLSSFFFLFSSPNLSGRRLDVYRTSTHGVVLVRI